MKFGKLNLFFALISIVILGISCDTTTSRLKKLNTEISQINETINDAFKQTKLIAEKNRQELNDLFTNRNKYDLSFDDMEDNFEFFSDFLYYQKKNTDDGLFYYYIFDEDKNNKEYFTEVKKVIKLISYVLPDFKKRALSLNFKNSHFIFTPHHIALQYPAGDPTSTLQPGFPKGILEYFEWWSNAIPKNNPKKEGHWTKDAFIGVAGEGWMSTYSIPFYSNGDKFEGVTTKDLYILDFTKLIKNNEKDIIIFLSPSISILGMSKKCKDVLKLQELTDVDYVKQMQANEFIPDKYNLSYEKNDPGIKNIATKIKAGEMEFDQEIGDQKFSIIVSKLDEVDYYIIGLLQID